MLPKSIDGAFSREILCSLLWLVKCNNNGCITGVPVLEVSDSRPKKSNGHL